MLKTREGHKSQNKATDNIFKTMFNRTKAKIANKGLFNRVNLSVFAVLFAGIGGYFIINSFASTTPTAPANANIWVSPTGSSTVGTGTNCQRVATAAGYDPNKDCSWAAAYKAALNGDVVNVTAGDYGTGNITFSPKTDASTPTVTFYVSGGTAQIGDVYDVPSNVRLNGPVIASALDVGGASGVTVDGWEIDGKFDVQQILNFVGSPGFTFRNGSVHSAYADILNEGNPTTEQAIGSMAIGGGSGITIENTDFYDASIKPPITKEHTECLYLTGASNVVLRGNHFWACSVMDVFITDWYGAGMNVKATNFLVENNIFEKPGGPNGNAFAFRTDDTGNVTPDPDGFVFRYNTFGPNSGMQWTQASNPVTTNRFQLYGNYAPSGLGPCGKTNVDCANNRTSSATGFVNAVVPNGDGIGQGAGHLDPEGDFHLSSASSPLVDAGTTSLPFVLLNTSFFQNNAPTAYPATDKDGNNRYARSAPDIGAYEFEATSGGGNPAPVDHVVPYDAASPWNTPIPANVQVNSDSAANIQYLSSLDLPLTSDVTQCTIPVYLFDNNTPKHDVTISGNFRAYLTGDNSQSANLKPTITGVPIPAAAAAEQACDGQIEFWNPVTGEQFGFWLFGGNASSGYSATNGYHYYTKAGFFGRFAGGLAGRGAGTPYLAGLVRPWEIYQGRIDHALAFAYADPCCGDKSSASTPKKLVYPAAKSDGASNNLNSAPEGTRFQLNPNLTDAQIQNSPSHPTTPGLGCTGACFTIAKALQKYGMYSIDNSGSSKIYLEDNSSADWDTQFLSVSDAASIRHIPEKLTPNNDWSNFRAVAPPCDPTAGSCTTTPDTTPPTTTITAKPTNPTTSTSASFTFSANETATFQCKLDTASFASCTSPKAYTVAVGSHTFTVKATDTAGNAETPGASQTYTWTVNSPPVDTPPTVSLSAPSANAKIRGTATISATATDNNSVSNVVFKWTKGTTTTTIATDTSSPYSTSWNTTGLADGTYSLTATATDSANQTTTSSAVSVTVDNTPPTTTISSSPNSPTNSTSASFAFASNETGSTFKCGLDDSNTANFTTCTSPKAYSGLLSGSHTFYVQATDPTGNVDATPATYTWNIDLTGPTTILTPQSPLPTPQPTPVYSTSNTSASFAFDSTEPTGDSFQCKLDTPSGSGTYASCTSIKSYTNLAIGTYTFTVKATDIVGNPDPNTPPSYSWKVVSPADTTPPTVSVNAIPNASNLTGNVDISATASDNVAVAAVQFKLDGNNIGSEITTPTAGKYTYNLPTAGYTNGAHTITAVARDTAGLTTTSAVANITINNTTTPPPDTTPPNAPTNLVAQATSISSITLTWSPSNSSDVAGYNIYRSTTTTFSNTPLTNVGNTTTFTDNGLSTNTTYYYKVSAVDNANTPNESTKIGPANATTKDLTPTATITANPTTVNSGGSSKLSWTSSHATVCTASGTSSWTGTKGTSGTNFSTGPLTASSTFNLSCSGSGGTANANAKVTVNGSPTPPPPANPFAAVHKPGDVDGNGRIELTDLSLLLGHWNQAYENADFRDDGIVNLTDLSILLGNWGH